MEVFFIVSLEQLDKARDLEAGSGMTPDPYCYRVGKTLVHISFTPGAAPLEDKLKAYFTGLKQNAFGVQTDL